MHRFKMNHQRWLYLLLVLITILSQVIYAPTMPAAAATGKEVAVTGLTGVDALDESDQPITDSANWTDTESKTIKYKWTIADGIVVNDGDYTTFTLPAGTVFSDDVTNGTLKTATGEVVGYFNATKGATTGTITFNDYFSKYTVSRAGTLQFLASGTKAGTQANGLLLKNGWGINPNDQGFSTEMQWQLSFGPDPNETTQVIDTALTNVVLVDKIDAGNQTLNSAITVQYATGSHDEEPVFGKDYTLVMNTANSFTITWLGPLSDKVQVLYTTKITDQAYMSTGQAAYFKNNAILTGQKNVTTGNPNGEPINPDPIYDNTDLHFTRKLGGASGSATGDAVTSVPFNKVWVDNNDQDGLRPTSIMVQLYRNGTAVNGELQTISASDGWQGSFTNLPKNENGVPINYTVKEIAVPAGYTSATSITTSTTEDSNIMTITNTHTPATTTIKGQKIWADQDNQDGLRPTSITVNLLANGQVVDHQDLTANHETYEFTNLPVNAAGQPIVYQVAEASVPVGYTSTVSADNTTITNTHTPAVTTINGQKIWHDQANQAGIRPEKITVNLLADGKFLKKVSVTAQQNWQFSFADLPVNQAGQAIKYTVTEDQVAGYTSQVNGYEITNTLVPTTPVTPEQPQTPPTTKPTKEPTPNQAPNQPLPIPSRQQQRQSHQLNSPQQRANSYRN